MRTLVSAILTLGLLLASTSATNAAFSGDPMSGLVRSEIFSLAMLPQGGLLAGGDGLLFRTEPGLYAWRVVAIVGGERSVMEQSEVSVREEDSSDELDADFDARVEERLRELVADELAERERDLRESIFDENLLEELLAEEEEELLDFYLPMAEAEILDELEAEFGLAMRVDESEGGDEEEVSDRRVHHLLTSPGDLPFLVASTEAGVLLSTDGRSWQRIATGGEGAQRARASAWWEGALWVATADGLYRGDPRGGRLERDGQLPLRDELTFVAACGTTLLVSDGREIATRRAGEAGWSRANVEGARAPGLRFLGCEAPALDADFVAAGDTGVFVWRGSTQTWASVTELGLPSREVRMVASDAEGTLWAATSEGLARWQGDRWRGTLDLPIGTDVRWIVEIGPGQLLVATLDGLFELLSEEREQVREALAQRVDAWLADDPSFAQVVQAAHGALGISPLRMDHWKRQDLVWAGLVPSQLSVQGRWHQRDTFRLDRREDQPAGTVRGTDLERRQVYWEFLFRMQWDFGPFVDTEREIRLASAERGMMTTERRVSASLLRLWNDRRNALLALLASEEADLQTRARLTMQVLRLSAELDALTGWRFGFDRARGLLMED